MALMPVLSWSTSTSVFSLCAQDEAPKNRVKRECDLKMWLLLAMSLFSFFGSASRPLVTKLELVRSIDMKIVGFDG